MLEALGLEIAAIKKSGGSTSIDLLGGTFVACTNRQYIYRFPLTEEVRLRDDTPIRIQFGQQEVEGSVVSLKDGVLILALEEDLGPKLPRVRLVADDSFLIQRLKDRLEQVQSGEAQFNRTVAHRVIGLGTIQSASADIPDELLHGRPPLNESQIEAVRKSLASDMTFVWGPPGTGKTTTLARIVEGHYFAGKSVLLVSNTNIAVDTALEKIAERLKGDPGFQAGAVIRFGPVGKEELLQKFGDQVVLENVVARLSESIQQELVEARSEASRLSNAADQLREAIAQRERVASLAETLQREQRSRERLNAKTQEFARTLQAQEDALRSLRHDLERAGNMGAVRRFFAGLNPERLAEKIGQTQVQHKATADAMKASESEYAETNRTIQHLEAEHRTLAARIKNLPPMAQCKKQLAPLEARIEQLNQQIAALEKQLDQIRQDIINRCRIIATTVYRTYLKGQVERQFDVVVIDEASMLMLPMSFYAAGLAKQAVTVAGDFRQLPAIVMSKETLTDEWLKTDVFFKCEIPKQIAKGTAPDCLVALRTQYRMHEDICSVVNDLFYDDHRLITERPPGSSGPQFPLARKPLTYIDTASLCPWASMRMGTFSRYNLLHALLIKKLIVHLAAAGYIPPLGETNERIGAVAPFGAQTRLIQALLQDALGGQHKGIAATVHRFQGNEKDTMLVDLTESTGPRWISKFMKGGTPEDEGSRLLNVAFSRARDHVVLIANFDYLRSMRGVGSVVLSLLDLFIERGEPLDLKKVLPLGEEDWIDGLHQIVPPNISLADGQSGAFDEGTFYPAFMHDLEHAEHSVLIFSPFMTGRGTSRWVDYFRVALQRGASIRIVTKPSAESDGSSEEETEEAIDQLRDLGITIDLRAKMHEKVAFIDKHILWLGSLNILSHKDTSECMVRLTGETLCRQLFEFISTPSGRKDEVRDPSESENPPCPNCGAPTTLKDGRFGIYFECVKECGGKVDPRGRTGQRGGSGARRGRSGKRGGKQEGVRPCPRQGCNGQLVQRNGRYGPFLGCSNFPRCRQTQDL
ncbi:MAG: AAA domain-containing protein [Planctomycetota bacterium]